MKQIKIAEDMNYIAIFLTFTCQLRCTYCINHHGGDLFKGRRLNGAEWVQVINRLQTKPDLPITIQGGEPTTHKDFYQIIRGIREDIPIDLLTNLEIDVDKFSREIPPERLKRDAPYASIRVSYHHGQSNLETLKTKVIFLRDKGYHIGVFEVDHPDCSDEVYQRKEIAVMQGIDWRIKEFLGPHRGKNYGTFKYPEAVNSRYLRHCDCKTSELLIDPAGHVFRCHSDLYANRSSIGNLCDPLYSGDGIGKWKFCGVYGKCNSCDIKVKNDRFQVFGHSSVEIKDIGLASSDNKDYVKEVKNTYGRSS